MRDFPQSLNWNYVCGLTHALTHIDTHHRVSWFGLPNLPKPAMSKHQLPDLSWRMAEGTYPYRTKVLIQCLQEIGFLDYLFDTFQIKRTILIQNVCKRVVHTENIELLAEHRSLSLAQTLSTFVDLVARKIVEGLQQSSAQVVKHAEASSTGAGAGAGAGAPPKPRSMAIVSSDMVEVCIQTYEDTFQPRAARFTQMLQLREMPANRTHVYRSKFMRALERACPGFDRHNVTHRWFVYKERLCVMLLQDSHRREVEMTTLFRGTPPPQLTLKQIDTALLPLVTAAKASFLAQQAAAAMAPLAEPAIVPPSVAAEPAVAAEPVVATEPVVADT